MRRTGVLIPALALLLTSAVPASGGAAGGWQDPRPDGPGPGTATAAAPIAIAVIGASVSAGFVDPRPAPDGSRNETVDLARVLEQALPNDQASIRQSANVAMFMSPAKFGQRAVERALKGEPDLVIAIDFLFWFGYGRGAQDEEQALAKQREGLALLERFDCPIIVGDYPDMKSADPGMLPPSSVPPEKVLAALNEGVRKWAEGRENVRLFPVSDWATKVRRDGERVTLEDGEVVAMPDDMLQGDRLHMSRFGVAVLAHKLLAEARGMLGGERTPSGFDPSIDRLIEITGAGPTLDEIRAR